MSEEFDTCVVGAGIAGLIAARRLLEENHRVTVLDKGKGVGGRMSVRRFSRGIFDHGAQFFSVKDQRFAEMLQVWKNLGLVERWSNGFKKFDGTVVNKGQPYYRGITGMNAVAKHLAATLDVRVGTRVTQIVSDKENWLVTTENGEQLSAHSLIMTPPVPQTLQILKGANFNIGRRDYNVLKQINYDPCLALLVVLQEESKVPEPGGLFGSGEPIQWIADNTRKGISPHAFAVTIHAGPNFTREYWETDDEIVKNHLIDAASEWLGSEIKHYQVQRWRYSKPVEVYPEACYVLEAPGALVLAGDAFGGPRVEGAALSGLAAANSLLRK